MRVWRSANQSGDPVSVPDWAQFKQRIQAIVEGFKALQDDLEGERQSTLRRWAAKEKQLELVMAATTGMYGDLPGIAGKTLPEIEGLDPKALPAANGDGPVSPA